MEKSINVKAHMATPAESLTRVYWKDQLFFLSDPKSFINNTVFFASMLALRALEKETDDKEQFSAKWIVVNLPLAVFTCAWAVKCVYHYSTSRFFQIPKDIVLVLQAEEDEENAFEINSETKRLFRILEKDHYEVIVYRVSTIYHASKAIRTVVDSSRKIKGLWLRGHGNSFSITLGRGKKASKSEINQANIDKLANALQLLDREASIILDSCSTGKKERHGHDLAWKFAKCAPNRKVFAPTEDIYCEPVLCKTRPIVVKFYLNVSSDVNVTAVRFVKPK